MDVNEIAKLLPEEPRPGMVEDAFRYNHYTDLGGEYLIYKRESIEVEPELHRTMTDEDFEEFRKNTEYRWGAICRCTACGEEFITGYENKYGQTGIKIFQGEDGQLYPGYVSPDYDNYDVTYLNSGTQAFCPYCNAKVTVKAKSKLGNGKKHQVLVTSVERVGNYAAIVTWLLQRQLNSYGFWDELKIIPRNAVVIVEKGKIRCFRHTDIHFFNDTPTSEWKPIKGYDDPQFKKYYSYEAICHTKIGGFIWSKPADLTGTTGEKTGLQTYIEKEGCYPAIYTRLQKKYPQLENIVKSQFFYILESELEYEINASINYYGTGIEKIEDLKCLDLSEVKPHKMLHFTKGEFKNGMLNEWTWETAYAWLLHDYYIADMSASDFDEYIAILGESAVSMLDGEMIEGADYFYLPEVTKYLFKQEEKHGIQVCEGVQYLIDYREELYRQNGGNITDEQRWPRNLLIAHDRIMRTAQELSDPKSVKNFNRISKKYKALEFNDGELCIRVARSSKELTEEGKVLRHCVGSYGTSHLKESDVIFFVRKYRRPERSYYTLDICMNDGEPREVQLHGYGNEHHGEYKQYRHSIPKKVRDFVDRWKKEVLMPFYYREMAKQKKKESKSA